jgi:uncharacterized membrane protein
MNNHLVVEENNSFHVNLLMLPIGLIVCAIIGGIMGFVSYNYFSLVIAFPAIMGIVAGLMAQKTVYRTDGKHSWWGMLLAILFALFTYGVFRYTEYYLTFEDYGTQIKAIATFRNYLDWSAAQGISISRASSSSSGFDLEGQGVWIFWGVEILIMLIVAYSSSQYSAPEKEEAQPE